jgi:drug/metabolite transporter (DMT)-like permease
MSSSTPSLAGAYSGVAYIVGAAFFWSLTSLFVKFVGQGGMSSQQIVLIRAVVTLIYSRILIWWSDEASLWGTNVKLLWLQGFFGFATLSCFFFALTKLPLADATVIHYTNPVFTALIAAAVLGEKLRASELFGALASLGGVALIAQPSFALGGSSAALNLTYVGIALLGAICASSAQVLIRKLRETEHSLVVVFYLPLAATLGGLPTAAGTELQWPTLWEWVMLVGGVAGCAQAAQVLLTKGLHNEKAGRAMVVSYLQIVFAAAWGLLVFGETMDSLSVAGALLITVGTSLAASKSGEEKR